MTITADPSTVTDPRVAELDTALADPRFRAWAEKLTVVRSKLLGHAARKILGA